MGDSMELLKEKNCRIVDSAADWQDAIRISVKPLEEEGDVKSCYKEEIIRNVNELGPYFILAPGVAMPHARPEQGAVNTQIAVTLLRHPVVFDKDDAPVSLLIALSAADSNSHIDTLMTIADVLQDEEETDKLLNASTSEQLYECFHKA